MSATPNLAETPTRPSLRSRAVPDCPLCGASGRALYRGLRDRFAALSQEWQVSRCTDPACGLLWLDPMPLVEDIGRAYHADYYTHQDKEFPLTWYRRGFRRLKRGYLAGRYGYRSDETGPAQRLLGLLLWLMPLRRIEVDASVMHLPFLEDGRLLEVGCGGGTILQILRDLGWQVEGVDFDPVAVAHARAKGLTVHLGPLAEQRLPDRRFDAIVMSHVIEHVHDPGGLLAECRRLLKPEGTLIVLTPNADGLCRRVFGASCYYLDPPRHLHVFNTCNLRLLLERSGFAVRRLWTRARGGRSYWTFSSAIRKTGRAHPDAPQPIAVRVLGLVLEALEMLLAHVKRDAGGEVVLLAKPR